MLRSFWSISASSGATLLRQLRIRLRERLGRERDDFFAQCAHLDHLLVQERELFIKPASHQPNLPVM